MRDAYIISMNKARRDIRALSLDELRRFFTLNAVPAFKGNQVYEWLWSKGSHDFEDVQLVKITSFAFAKNILSSMNG